MYRWFSYDDLIIFAPLLQYLNTLVFEKIKCACMAVHSMTASGCFWVRPLHTWRRLLLLLAKADWCFYSCLATLVRRLMRTLKAQQMRQWVWNVGTIKISLPWGSPTIEADLNSRNVERIVSGHGKLTRGGKITACNWKQKQRSLLIRVVSLYQVTSVEYIFAWGGFSIGMFKFNDFI